VRSLGGCAITLLALVLAGCGGESGGADERSPASSTETATAAPAESSEAPATDPEVAWAGRVIDWAILVGSAVEVVGSSAEPLAEGKRPLPKLRGPVSEALRALTGCSRHAETEIGKAPSERLRPVRSAIDTACDHYASGAAAALQIVRGSPDAEALAGEWESTWSDGGEVMSSISEALVRYQPANTRTLPEKSGESRESRIEPEFGAVASALVETDVEVRCWSERDWKALIAEMQRFTNGRIRAGTIGFAGHGDHRLNLAPDVCEGLVALKYGNARPPGDKELAFLAIAVETLMHEAQHVRGVWNEAGAECYGMQMTRDAARRLGATRAYAAKLAEVYWEELYALLPDDYRSDECRDGGAMDAHPASTVWP
jgi:hypothetical protein